MMNNFVVDTSDNRMLYVKKALEERGYEVEDYENARLENSGIFIFSPAKSFKDDEIASIPKGSIVYAGNVKNIDSEAMRERNIAHVNLLHDEVYAYENAMYTAEVALMLIIRNTAISIYDMKVLILGYGRVGKALAHLLHSIGVDFAIGARRYEERASAYLVTDDIRELDGNYSAVDCIINTIPAPIMSREAYRSIDSDCYILDLASYSMMSDEVDSKGNYAIEHGLPGRYTPKSAGDSLVASVLRTIMR